MSHESLAKFQENRSSSSRGVYMQLDIFEGSELCILVTSFLISL